MQSMANKSSGSAARVVTASAAIGYAGVAASNQRRSKRAGGLSLAGRGVAIALVSALAGERAVASPPPTSRDTAARPAPGAGARTHVHREPVARAPVAVRSLADLTISYDAPTGDGAPDSPADATGGAERPGIGASVATWRADGVATLAIPEPVRVSLARAPRPKHDYSKLRIPGASRFAGEAVKLELTIDVHGKVRSVQLLQGVDRGLDRKTVALVRTFEYEPALDDDGVAIQGTSRWDVQIVVDEDEDMFDSARERAHR